MRTYKQIAADFKLAREAFGPSLRQVEKDTGISNAYLSQLESGKIKNPGIFVIAELCRYYGLSIDEVTEFDK